MSEADKAAVRARALELLRDYRDRGCTLPPPPSRETIHRMMSFMVGEPVPEPYTGMMLEEMALDGRDQRDVPFDRDLRGREAGLPRAGDRRGHVRPAGRDPPPGGRPAVHGGGEERRGGRHLVREHLPGLPGGHRQPLLLLLVRAEPRLVRVLLPAGRAARLLRALRDEVRRAAPHPLPHRGAGSPLRRGALRLGRAPARSPTASEETQRFRAVISAVGQLNRAEDSGDPRPRIVPGPGLPLRAVGARPRPARQAGGGGRHGRERVPARARGGEGREAPARLPAVARLDAAEPELPREGEPREEVAARARTLLRALVPLPALLAGLRRAPALPGDRPRVAASRSLGERPERGHARSPSWTT